LTPNCYNAINILIIAQLTNNCKIAIKNIMKKGNFDASAFFSALDAQRVAKQMNWKEVASQSGVSASTLTRMAQGRRPDVDSLAALIAWSGLDMDNFIYEKEAENHAEPLAMISSYLHADRNLTEEGAIALEELIKATYERLRKK
jgi:transcriptional regulator with XRE-family HTH domain